MFKEFKNGPKAAYLSVIVIICLLIILFSFRKTIIIQVDGTEIRVNTFRSNVSNILKDNNIAIAPKDKVSPSLNSIIKNGDKIVIKKAVNILVQVDGKTLKISSAEDNIENMLASEKITIFGEDRISLPKEKPLQEGLKLVITRVQTKTIKDVEQIDYATVIKNDDNMIKGKTKILQEGIPGNREITTKVVYEDGKEVSRNVIKNEIISKPVEKIVASGTLGTINLSRGGEVLYKRSIKVKATAYAACYSCTGKNPTDVGFGITATGTKARRVVDGYSSIAVDPRIIPLGTKLYIPNYGLAIAEDVGGGIKGNAVDLFFNSVEEAFSWGNRQITIYVIK